jgi:hypothetical protein
VGEEGLVGEMWAVWGGWMGREDCGSVSFSEGSAGGLVDSLSISKPISIGSNSER